MPYKKGESGNPGGRRKQDLSVRDAARQHTTKALETLIACLDPPTADNTRVAAANALLDRGWGRATQPIGGDEDLGPLIVRIIDPTRRDGG